MFRSRISLPAIVALVVAASVIGISIRISSFVPWGTDAAAYIEEAHRWAEVDLFRPATFLFWAPWAEDGRLETPLGFSLGPTVGTNVGIYPLGYPLLMAAALRVTGNSLAPYLVGPLFAGILAWCAYLLASQLSSPWAGVVASVLIAGSPVTLANATSPMSDVPAVALWALSWVVSLRAGHGAAAAAGLAASLAIMVRPNLAPLAGVIAIVTAASTPKSIGRWLRLGIFVLAAAVGPAVLLWCQSVLYGNPLTPGYGGASGFFSTERILPNLRLYPRLLVDLHGWLVVLGVLLFPLTFRHATKDQDHSRRKLIASAAVGIILVNFALYLPYLTFEGWYWFRFMLPALLAILILFAASLDRVRLLLASRGRLLSLLVIFPVVVVALTPRDQIRQVVRDNANEGRVSLMGNYLRESLPANAVILTFLQSAAVAHYTHRPILRLDLLDPSRLDAVVTDLSRRGYQPGFVIDDAMEHAGFRARFAGSLFQALEWPARAEFWTNSRVSYFVPADRFLYPNDEIYPVDIVRWPASRRSGDEMADRQWPTPLFPPLHESRAFRQMLEDKYKNDLQRSSTPTYVDLDHSIVWIQRYLRYRLHACSHGRATNQVLIQVSGRAVPAVCGRRALDQFPPWDELVDFRRQLESTYREERHQPSASHVDFVGDAVWTQEYLRYRLSRCSHEQAAERVFQQIDGKGIQPGCS